MILKAMQFILGTLLGLIQLSLNENLDKKSWTKRTKEEVYQQARNWLNAKNITQQRELATAFGVRFCSLHKTGYWDPVKHIILGFLHNWLEGVLQHQLRQLWGVGRKEVEDKDEDFTSADIADSAEELSELESENPESDELESDEAETFTPRTTPAPDSDSTPRGTPAPDADFPAPRTLRPRRSTTVSSDSTSTSQGTPPPTSQSGRSRKIRKAVPVTILSMVIDEDMEDKDRDYKAPIEYSFHFSPEELQSLREAIRDISLPTWVSRPPTNLGEKSHGKLKADQFLNLFTVIFPLFLPAIFFQRGNKKLLDSFYNLTAATNIIVAFKTSDSEAEAYIEHYTDYRRSIKELFPEFASLPNHHYAMHNDELLMYWGPLACLNDMDFTMLQQTARLSRFLAFLDDTASGSPNMNVFANILGAGNITKGSTIQFINDSEQATYMKDTATALNMITYNMILHYLNMTQHYGQYHSSMIDVHLPLHAHALVLPPLAKRCSQFHENGRTYSINSSHEANSFIQFYDRQIQRYRTGVINNIFEIPLQGYLRKFILVLPYKKLAQSELEGTPYDEILYPRFMSTIVEVQPSEDILVIEPEHIITHLTTFKTRGDIYGIKREIRVVCWALNRERKEYPVT
ncbi:hypothetical protein K438DRAFT_1776843 [Mycena galopus ATCC 62051]|nr:hypothetical protein K438DRAFT_1776843 [Mycena galopus ATCC 62051]